MKYDIIRTMKKTNVLKTEMILCFDPEKQREIAKKALAKVSDDKIAEMAKSVREQILPFFDEVQKRYQRGAAKIYAASEEKKLFVEKFDSVYEELQQSEDSLLHIDRGSLTIPEPKYYTYIRDMLSSSVVVCYPCWKFSEELTDREIVYLLKKLNKSEFTINEHKLLEPLRSHEFFCLRDATPEYQLQNKLFDLLRRICFTVVSTLKKWKVHDAAMPWLKVIGLLEERHKGYSEALKEETADKVVALLKEGYEQLVLEFRYEYIDKELK